jgi:hypothetical protein
MLDNPYLDTIISVVLIYALLSIIVSLLLEAWNSLRKVRGEFLWKVIVRSLTDQSGNSYGQALYSHPIITALFTEDGRKPGYISAQDFTNALIGTVTRLHPPPGIPAPPGTTAPALPAAPLPLARAFEASVAAMDGDGLKRLLKGFVERSKVAGEVELDRLRADICRWYDDRMDRATGEYKLGQRNKLVVFGFITAIALNVDSLHMVRMILMDKPLRDNLVAQAGVAADAYEANKGGGEDVAELAVLRAFKLDTDSVLSRVDALRVRIGMDSLLRGEAQRMDTVLALLEQWRLPLGWSGATAPSSWCSAHSTAAFANMSVPDRVLLDYVNKRNAGGAMEKFLYFLGILISGFALSFGAPFWFETLVKLINIRRTGTKPQRADQRAK